MQKYARMPGIGLTTLCLTMWVGRAIFAGDVPAKTEAGATATNATTDALSRQITFVEAMMNGTDEMGKPMLDPGYKQATVQQFSRLARCVDDKNYREAVQICDSIMSYPSPAVFRKTIKELGSLISLQVKIDQSNTLAEVRSLMADLPATCAKAK